MSLLKSIILNSESCTLVYDPSLASRQFRFDIVCKTKAYQCVYMPDLEGNEDVKVYYFEEKHWIGSFGRVAGYTNILNFESSEVIDNIIKKIKPSSLPCSSM